MHNSVVGAARSGGLWIIMPGIMPLAPEDQNVSFGSTTVVEQILATGDEFQAWEKLVSVASIPEGTTLTYTIGRIVNGKRVADHSLVALSAAVEPLLTR